MPQYAMIQLPAWGKQTPEIIMVTENQLKDYYDLLAKGDFRIVGTVESKLSPDELMMGVRARTEAERFSLAERMASMQGELAALSKEIAALI